MVACGTPQTDSPEVVTDTKPRGQTGSDREHRGRHMGSDNQMQSRSTASGGQAQGATQGDQSETKNAVSTEHNTCTTSMLQQFVYTVPERIFSNISRNGTFGSTMTSVVCCRKMKGEPAFIKSGSAGKHSMIHFHISVNTPLFQGFPVIINHKI